MKTRHLLPALFATSLPLFANGGGYLKGIHSTGPFRPVNVDSVEMQSEKLDIELKQDAAVVSITYQLHNPGKAVIVEMGFPCSVVVKPKYDKEYKPIPITSLPQLEGFSLKADGEAVASKLVKDHATLPAGPPGPKQEEVDYEERVLTGWQVVKVPFSARQTRTVSVSYRNPYYREASSVSDNEDLSAPSMRYLFSAAGLWAGPIKTGEVTVRATGVDPEVVTLSHPKRFKREGSQWKWNFTDFEPTMQDDLEIVAGEHEFTQSRVDEEGNYMGTYIMRGRSTDHEELQKNGKWFFQSRRYTATATSSLKDAKKEFSYGPENLNDDDWENAWVEGAEGDGIGESITLALKEPQKITRLLITNGYRKDEELFKKNNRVKKFAVSINGGAPFSADLPDGITSDCAIALPADAPAAKTVTLTIQEVYRGTAYRDTCITGVTVETKLTKAPPIFPCR